MFRKVARVLMMIAVAAGVLLGILFYAKSRRSPWTVTQYGNDTGNQMMFYSITNARGQLVLIDGGWDTDAELVKSVIDAHGGHVDAWVITHPHPDHCGAFNAIMAANVDGSVVVDKIYTTPVNRKRYQETAHDYDRIEDYETFYILTKDADNVVYLNEGDAFDLIGLTGTVLHSWDEHVDALKDHLCNDGSLMFRLEAMKDSFLFCGDVQSEMEQYIVPAHKEELRSTYVQCGHHGNWGLTTDFYDLVAPEAAFMDAPSSVIDDKSGLYDGWELRDYFAKKEIPVYRFTSSPNSIVMR